MAFKFIPAEATGTWQNLNVRVIEDPDTIDLTVTPTSNLAGGVSQTGGNAGGHITGSLKSVVFDGIDDFVKLPATSGPREGLPTHIVFDNIGSGTQDTGKPLHGLSANNVSFDVWLQLTTTGQTDQRMFDITLQRSQDYTTSGFDGVYTGRIIYTDWPGRPGVSAHFIDWEYASGDNIAYSLTSSVPIESLTGADADGSPTGGLTGWTHVSCIYQAGRAPMNDGDNSGATADNRMQLYINGDLDRDVSTFVMENDLVGPDLNYPATAGPVESVGGISFDGRIDELRLFGSSGAAPAYAAIADLGQIGLSPEQMTGAVPDTFSPSANYLVAWWRLDSTSAVELFSGVAGSIEDYSDYLHDGTPVNFEGSVDFTEDQVIVQGLSASGDIHSLSGSSVDHGGLVILYPDNNTVRYEYGDSNLVKTANNTWIATGADVNIGFENKNIWMGSCGSVVSVVSNDTGVSHVIDYQDLMYDRNEYVAQLRLLSVCGSPSARVSFTLGDTTNTITTTAILSTVKWEPVIVRNTMINDSASLTGRIDITALGGSSKFLIDALQVTQGTYHITPMASDRRRPGGEMNWIIRD